MLAPPKSHIATPPSLDGTPSAITAGTAYRAFPGIAKLATGDLLVVFREATDHVSVDGTIRKTVSDDEGATWSALSTILTPGGGLDARDPEVLVLEHGADAGRVIVYYTLWNGTSTDGSHTSWLIYSDDDGATWSSPVAVTNSFTFFAFVHGMTELPNGDLLAAIYGTDDGDDQDLPSVRVSRSTDGGETWAHLAEVADGQTSRPWAEPNLRTLHSGEVLCGLRSDVDPGAVHNEIHLSRSTDSGATWSTPVGKVAGSGKPALFQSSTGLLYLARRSPPKTSSTASFGDGRSALQVSNDLGFSWSGPSTELDFSNGSGEPMVYASFVELDSGQVAMVYSLEHSSTDADLYFVKLTGGS